MKNNLVVESKSWLEYIKSKRGEELKKDLRQIETITKIEKRFKIKKARSVGYKALKGYLVYIVKVKAGGPRRRLPSKGRRSKRFFANQFSIKIDSKTIAVRRLMKTHTNLAYLKAYELFKDSKNKWYEVIMVDPLILNIALFYPLLIKKGNKTKIFRSTA